MHPGASSRTDPWGVTGTAEPFCSPALDPIERREGDVVVGMIAAAAVLAGVTARSRSW